jgi:hypothetical protein
MSKKNVYPYDRRNFTLSFNVGGEPEYFIDNEKKKVTCVITGTFVTPTISSWDAIGDTPLISANKFKVIGRAICSDKDVFDAERGMRIALAKAELKAYRAARDYIKEETQWVRYIANKSMEFIAKADAFEKHNAEHINVLSDVNNPNYMKELRPLKHGKVTYKN